MDLFSADDNSNPALNNSCEYQLDAEYVERLEVQSPSSSVNNMSIIFKSKQFIHAAAKLHLSAQMIEQKMVDNIGTVLYIIYNHSAIKEQITNFISNGGNINVIFNQLVSDLTFLTFQDYLKLEEVIELQVEWPLQKRTREKSNIRKRYSRAFRTVLKKLKIDQQSKIVYTEENLHDHNIKIILT
jgi:hypothetical protein